MGLGQAAVSGGRHNYPVLLDHLSRAFDSAFTQSCDQTVGQQR
jgi:hypothetical protein